MLTTIKKWLPSKRKLMQLYFALLFNANLKGFLSGNIYQGSSKQFCVPGLNCYSCPGAVAACPLGSLQGAFSAGHSTIWYVGGILLLYGLMFGRMICGWLCPFGLIQELFYKIKTPKLKKSRATRLLSWLKYGILVFFVFLVPILYAFRDMPLPAFCKYICPAGTLEGGLVLLSNSVNKSYLSMLGHLFSWKFLLLISAIVGCIFIFRLFCRFICPLGAIYGIFNKISFLGILLNKSKCVDCGLCLSECKVDIRHVGDQECISCGACVPVCPTKAITWKGPKIFLSQNETATATRTKQRIVKIISAVLLVALLVGTLIFSFADSGLSPQEGNQIGDLCYSYSLEIIDENGANGQQLDPSATGKVTVINFWGTWCTPCLQELPYFSQLASDYADEVTVVAVHSALSRDTAPEYIGKYYPDSKMLFSWDQDDNGEFYTMLGGRGTYPYTLILDENGRIANIFLSALTYDDLKAAVDALLQ